MIQKSEIETISFGLDLKIWKSTFDIKFLEKIIEISKNYINKQTYIKNGAYHHTLFNLSYDEYKNFKFIDLLDELIIKSTSYCEEIYNDKINELLIETWINIVKSKNFSQKITDENNDLFFHNHVELNLSAQKKCKPQFTFVCYLQMPNNLRGDDGVLYLKDKNEKIYSILPKVGDIIIMGGDVPHVPNISPNSNLDRIVLAGNVEFKKNKINKTFI